MNPNESTCQERARVRTFDQWMVVDNRRYGTERFRGLVRIHIPKSIAVDDSLLTHLRVALRFKSSSTDIVLKSRSAPGNCCCLSFCASFWIFCVFDAAQVDDSVLNGIAEAGYWLDQARHQLRIILPPPPRTSDLHSLPSTTSSSSSSSSSSASSLPSHMSSASELEMSQLSSSSSNHNSSLHSTARSMNSLDLHANAADSDIVMQDVLQTDESLVPMLKSDVKHVNESSPSCHLTVNYLNQAVCELDFVYQHVQAVKAGSPRSPSEEKVIESAFFCHHIPSLDRMRLQYLWI